MFPLVVLTESVVSLEYLCTALFFAFVLHDLASVLLTAMSSKIAFAMVPSELCVAIFEGTG